MKAQGAVETGGKLVGGIVGGVAGAMGGSALGLVGYAMLGASGLGSGVIVASALVFGALGAWGGSRNGGGIGQLVEGFFK